MKTSHELITPKKAQEMLLMNTMNRPAKESIVNRYADDMSSGRWKANTFEFIKVGVSGKILDGQHRLMAVERSGVPIYFHVARGVDDNLMDVIDTGTKRSGSDVLSMSGVKNSARIAAIIAKASQFQENYFSKASNYHRLTNAQVLERYNGDKEEWESILSVSVHLYESFSKVLSISDVGGFYKFLKQKNENDALKFMTELCEGIDITNKVIALLRKRLYDEKMSLRKIPLSMRNALIIKTWNMYRQNRTVKVLSFDPNKEKFPKAI